MDGIVVRDVEHAESFVRKVAEPVLVNILLNLFRRVEHKWEGVPPHLELRGYKPFEFLLAL